MISNYKSIALFMLLTLINLPLSVIAEVRADLDTVYRLMNTKKFDAAVNKLDKLVKQYPNDGDVWYQYSLALLRNGNVDKSIQASQKTATFEGYEKYANFNLGLAYADKGQNELALKIIHKSMHDGYLNFDRLKNEEALETLRNQGQFKFSPEQEYKTFTAHNKVKIPYKTLLPHNYDRSKTYKAMMAFPSGSYGKSSADWMINSMLDFESNKDWIITIVTAPKDGLINHPAHHALNDLMKHLREKYSVSNNKFHFLGYQSGGTPAVTYSQMSNNYITGITVINTYTWDDWKDSSLKSFDNTPTHILVGSNDKLSVKINKRAYDIIKANGNKIEIEYIENQGTRISSLEKGELFKYLK